MEDFLFDGEVEAGEIETLDQDIDHIGRLMIQPTAAVAGPSMDAAQINPARFGLEIETAFDAA